MLPGPCKSHELPKSYELSSLYIKGHFDFEKVATQHLFKLVLS